MGRAVIPPAKLGHGLQRELVRRDRPPNKTDAAQSPPRPRFSACESILVARSAIKVMVVPGVLIGGSDVLS
jgi:hypothetical protein